LIPIRMKEFHPHLEILPPAQARLWRAGASMAGTVCLARAIRLVRWNRSALSYFDDGNLRDLPNDLKLRLVEAAREVDLDHLPVLSAEFRRADMDYGLE
jgi:hypothetical protein